MMRNSLLQLFKKQANAQANAGTLTGEVPQCEAITNGQSGTLAVGDGRYFLTLSGDDWLSDCNTIMQALHQQFGANKTTSSDCARDQYYITNKRCGEDSILPEYAVNDRYYELSFGSCTPSDDPINASGRDMADTVNGICNDRSKMNPVELGIGIGIFALLVLILACAGITCKRRYNARRAEAIALEDIGNRGNADGYSQLSGEDEKKPQKERRKDSLGDGKTGLFPPPADTLAIIATSESDASKSNSSAPNPMGTSS